MLDRAATVLTSHACTIRRMTDTEKALRSIYKRLGEIRDVLCEIRDGLIYEDEELEGDPEGEADDAPEEPAGPRALPNE